MTTDVSVAEGSKQQPISIYSLHCIYVGPLESTSLRAEMPEE